MAKVRWKWHMAGYREIRSAPKTQAEVRGRAERIASAAGPGMEVDSQITGGRGRARASVRTATTEARRAEANDRALTRALDAGR
jgi:hypothetical protein